MPSIKNQHYVPRFYLRRFLSKAKRLHVFDKSTGKSFFTRPENVACERYFYDVPDDLMSSGLDRQGVERYLQQIDDDGSTVLGEVLHDLVGGRPFDGRLAPRLAHFIAIQHVRTMLHREIGAQLWSTSLNNLLEKNWEIPEPRNQEGRVKLYTVRARDARSNYQCPAMNSRRRFAQRV